MEKLFELINEVYDTEAGEYVLTFKTTSNILDSLKRYYGEDFEQKLSEEFKEKVKSGELEYILETRKYLIKAQEEAENLDNEIINQALKDYESLLDDFDKLKDYWFSDQDDYKALSDLYDELHNDYVEQRVRFNKLKEFAYQLYLLTGNTGDKELFSGMVEMICSEEFDEDEE